MWIGAGEMILDALILSKFAVAGEFGEARIMMQ